MATQILITRGTRALRPAKLQLLLPRSRVPSVLPTTPANSVVALAEVLGSNTVVIPATQTLVTRGTRALRPAKLQLLLPRSRVPSAARTTPANSVVALAEVLGFRTVEKRATQILITRGTRALRPAKPRQPLFQLLLPRSRVPSVLRTTPANSVVALA